MRWLFRYWFRDYSPRPYQETDKHILLVARLYMSPSLHGIHGKIPQPVSIASHDCWQLDSSHIPGMTRTHHSVREKTEEFFYIIALTYPISQERYAGYSSSLIRFVIFCAFQIDLLNHINFVVHIIFIYSFAYSMDLFIYMHLFMKLFVFLPFY